MSAASWLWVALYFVVSVVGVVLARAYNGRKQIPLPKLFEEQTVFFSICAVLVLLTFWPLFLVGFALDPWITKLGYWRDSRTYKFHCRPEHLLGSVTVGAAEASAKVVDPLHRAPDLPFGHLNPAWHEFLTQRRFGYRLRSFCIPGTAPDPLHAGAPRWSTPQGQKLGYAWVRLWSVKAEFIHEWC